MEKHFINSSKNSNCIVCGNNTFDYASYVKNGVKINVPICSQCYPISNKKEVKEELELSLELIIKQFRG